jgi:hypothetical protein
MVLVFLNHFQLSVHYDVGLELLSTLRQDKATHISNHIQEWCRRKRLIKTCIPSEFLLEWFLKSLVPYILKDVSTFGVTSEEEVIFKAQQLDLIYAQSGMLYEILLDTPWSNYDPRQNLRPHADGILGSANVKYVDSVTSHLKELYLNHSIGGIASFVSSTPTQSTDVHYVQSSTNLNGIQQPGGNKKKGHSNNCMGGKNNNKPKENYNNEKSNSNVGEEKKERRKVKFPCKLCTDDHLTHLCPKISEVVRILSLPPVVLTNLFPHNHHMASSSLNAENMVSGSQNSSTQDSDRLCINMVKSEVNVTTKPFDYSSPHPIPSIESPPPPETPL